MSRRRFPTSRTDASPADPFGTGGLSSAASRAGVPGSPARARDRPGRRGVLGEVARAISRHRRLVAAGLAAAGVALALHLLAPEPPRTVTVLAAARDLPGGAPLTAGDLHEVALPPHVVPSGVLLPGDSRAGRPGRRGAVLAGPVRAGEPLTDARLLGPDLLARVRSSTQVVAAPVRVADPGSLALVRPGDRIDLLAAETGVDQAPRPARVVATHVRVLALPGSTGDGADSAQSGGAGGLGGLGSGGSVDTGGEGGLIVVAVPAETAADLARAAVTSRISLVLRAVP
ncbi:Flp pilus assembly protein CpaB [Actinopolymorpha rutila]|uniref:Flp pilus assembly protein CpaB n=1 Tax=Actinopolymorpha rutila TaxID=446787 RepID=A0A852Z9S7_9ACTN|nr:Flp pilus assembly protein CpaB [Actinopolymorpha rutila]NYH88592.1 Flp pilus assembly protein CpaB [Actinopolymorpha rutila]